MQLSSSSIKAPAGLSPTSVLGYWYTIPRVWTRPALPFAQKYLICWFSLSVKTHTFLMRFFAPQLPISFNVVEIGQYRRIPACIGLVENIIQRPKPLLYKDLMSKLLRQVGNKFPTSSLSPCLKPGACRLSSSVKILFLLVTRI